MLSSIYIGAVIGGTSSAVVIPMVRQLKLANKNQTVLMLESALSDVLCLVVGLAILDGIRAGAIDIGDVFIQMGSSFLFAALIGLCAGLLWSVLLNLVRSLQNSMFITLAFVFVLYGFSESFNFNGGIAVLTFGVLLGNNGFFERSSLFKKIFAIGSSTFDEHERRFYSEIVFILQTYFFVFIGIAIQFQIEKLPYYIIGFVVVAGIILVRPFGIKLVTRKETNAREVAIMSVLTPKGLITAVMASITIQLGIENADIISSIGYSVVLFSILICSILVIILGKDPLILTRFYGSGKQKEKLLQGKSEGIAVKEAEGSINTHTKTPAPDAE